MASQESVVVRHFEKVSQIKNEFFCNFCGKFFAKHYNVIQHERSHTGQKPFGCPLCKKRFAQKSNMKKHLATHKVWPEAVRSLRPVKENAATVRSRTIYGCQFCALECDSYFALRKHMSDRHKDEKVYKCLEKDCFSHFASLEEFGSHCDFHQGAGRRELNLENSHWMPAAKKQKKWKCGTCHSPFARLESLRQHEAVESHRHECAVCAAVFTTERSLRRHLACHADPLPCPTCGKPLRSGKGLRNHMLLHQPEEAFVCVTCGKRFVNLFRLRRHIAVHLEKPLSCTYRKSYGCEKKFYRKDKLLSHIKTHKYCNTSKCHGGEQRDVSSAPRAQQVNVDIYKTHPIIFLT